MGFVFVGAKGDKAPKVKKWVYLNNVDWKSYITAKAADNIFCGSEKNDESLWGIIDAGKDYSYIVNKKHNLYLAAQKDSEDATLVKFDKKNDLIKWKIEKAGEKENFIINKAMEEGEDKYLHGKDDEDNTIKVEHWDGVRSKWIIIEK